MTKPELLLLVNAERFISAVGYKTKWELELDRVHDLLLKAQSEKLHFEQEMNRFKEDFKDSQFMISAKE